jgi:ribosomal protein S18 acetylase RimI-like enzyme
MVMLKPMTSDGFERWWDNIWIAYREELVRSGETAEAAEEDVAQNKLATRPDGQLAPGNHVFDVVDGDQRIGWVWLRERSEDWFIYDIEIVENLRGQGFGRATMQAIEQHVRERGGQQIGLSVFGFNQTAQRLYISEGYETTRLSMLKKLK